MSHILEDGTGEGYKLRIDVDHRAYTRSMSEPAIAVKSYEEGGAYLVLTGVVTLNSTNEHKLIYAHNTSTKSFAINRYWFGWNGGSTNHNRTCIITQYFAPSSAPTVNHTPTTAKNLNTASGNAALMTVYIWNGVGDGMTVAGGVKAGESQIRQGINYIEILGSIIIAPGDSFVVAVKGEEIGTVDATIEGYYI